jgi:hypothetical protein
LPGKAIADGQGRPGQATTMTMTMTMGPLVTLPPRRLARLDAPTVGTSADAGSGQASQSSKGAPLALGLVSLIDGRSERPSHRAGTRALVPSALPDVSFPFRRLLRTQGLQGLQGLQGRQPATAALLLPCYGAAMALLARTADEALSLLAHLPVPARCGRLRRWIGPLWPPQSCTGDVLAAHHRHVSPSQSTLDRRPPSGEPAAPGLCILPLNGGGVGSKAAQISLTMGSLLVLLHRYFTPTIASHRLLTDFACPPSPSPSPSYALFVPAPRPGPPNTKPLRRSSLFFARTCASHIPSPCTWRLVDRPTHA